ncbi:hypothetical protein HYX10_03910 [Candidatus Woesearchaeota archaeon]|nr:hypothetical protein [Candidatus Woesearchaeota archaeon]
MLKKIIALPLLAMLVSGCALSGSESSVKVTELSSSRTHNFDYYTDGRNTLLKGSFSINGHNYDGWLLYTPEESAIYRSSSSECIVFDNPNKVLLGFLPPTSINADGTDATVEVLAADSQGRPVRYQIIGRETSIVEIKNPDSAIENSRGVDFNFPEGVVCVKEYELLSI